MSGVDLSSLSLDEQLSREWLITNGIGGFASSTIPSIPTRKYHGLLVAPMSPLVRQMVLLSRVDEFVKSNGQLYPLSSCEYPETVYPTGYQFLRAFSSDPFPRWAYQADGFTIEKQIRLIPGENTVLITYTLLGGGHSVDLELKPLFAFRGIHDLMYQWNGRLTLETVKAKAACQHRILATNRTPEVFFGHDGRFTADAHWYLNTIYRREEERGYPGLEDVWMPGSIWWTLAPGQSVHFACSTDPIDLPYVIGQAERGQTLAMPPAVAEEKPDHVLEALVRAAGQFLVEDRRAEGHPSSSVIAGYPWLPPSGRTSLIAFTGLYLVTGRLAEAKSLLESFAAAERDGLMPTEFPWDGSAPRYQGVDVSLWFINAVWHYLRYGGDFHFVETNILPAIESVLRNYRAGTALGIHIDADGLLASREVGTPTTWMNAKAGDWVVTPRYGRAVEVNALWYNAQRIAAVLLKRAGQEARADALTASADQTRAGFNERFWNEDTRCCYDVIDDGSADGAVRPNQLFALSLPFPVLNLNRHAAVLEIVRQELLTPVGIRSLSPSHGSYARRYAGGIESRDQAYHQGSAFPWLLGPYLTAYLALRGRSAAVRRDAGQLLKGSLDHLDVAGLGQICELFDGDYPHRPGGLPACARSIGELLRCYVEDVLDLAPAAESAVGRVAIEGQDRAEPPVFS